MDKNNNEYKELFESQEKRISKKFGSEITLIDIEFGDSDYIKDATFVLRHNCETCSNSIYRRKATTLYKRDTPCCTNCKNPENIKKKRFELLEKRLKGSNLDAEFTLIDIEKQTNGTHWIMHLRHNCEKCNNSVFSVTTENFFNNGNRCPNCRKLQFSEFKRLFYELNPDYILNSTDYEGNGSTKSKVSITHNCELCNHNTWYATPNNLIYGDHRAACPICSLRNNSGKSLGEDKIKEYCSINNIDYEYQYFRKIKNVRNAAFDFCINDIIIEYDGTTHFQDSFNDPTKLVKQKDCDKRKTQWCLDNGRSFLRIPYTEFKHIDEILTCILNDKDHHILEQYDIFYINHQDMILICNENGVYSELISNISI